MEEGSNEIDLPGKYSPLEEAVLRHLYAHPNWDEGTQSLTRRLMPDLQSETSGQDAKTDAYKKVLYAVETLISERLVAGERLCAVDETIYFERLKLTPKGEAQAIKEKRRPNTLVVDSIPRPERRVD
jgi:hypothetical protein